MTAWWQRGNESQLQPKVIEKPKDPLLDLEPTEQELVRAIQDIKVDDLDIGKKLYSWYFRYKSITIHCVERKDYETYPPFISIWINERPHLGFSDAANKILTPTIIKFIEHYRYVKKTKDRADFEQNTKEIIDILKTSK